MTASPGPDYPAAPRRMLLEVVREHIRVRHLSLRTEKAYCYWIRSFIHFHHENRGQTAISLRREPGNVADRQPPSKFSPEVGEPAVRLVQKHRGEGPSQGTACAARWTGFDGILRVVAAIGASLPNSDQK